MATSPAFAVTPRIGYAQCTTADSNRDSGVTSASTIVTGAATGTKIERVVAIHNADSAASSAGVVRLWLYNGTANYLFDEFTVTAITPSSTVVGWRAERRYDDLILPDSSSSLKASISISDSILVIAFGADL